MYSINLKNKKKSLVMLLLVSLNYFYLSIKSLINQIIRSK